MTPGTTDRVRTLLAAAIDLYDGDDTTRAQLREYRDRLDQPLRIALAGMIKAGKSTLLNALIGEEVAPTDAGECTRIVTWYRYGDTPRVTLCPVVGEPRGLPVTRVDGRLVLALGSTPADAVGRLVVEWPSRALRDLTLIDTPGIASLSLDVSARATDFLTPRDAPSEADAIVYLLRHLHATDLHFLDAFHDLAAGASSTVNAVGVLSRADEVGAGRLDALVSARDIAARYRREGRLQSRVLGVVPVAGLLAQSARTLRQEEYDALARIAVLERDDRELLMISADRFVRGTPDLAVDRDLMRRLLERLGLFGIRLATVLLRTNDLGASGLADELYSRSGTGELLRLIDGQFRSRAGALQARAVLGGLERVLVSRPRRDAERLWAELERLQADAGELVELRLLAAARTSGLPLERARAAQVERLLGAHGVDVPTRLGLPATASAAEVEARAAELLREWRELWGSPWSGPAVREVCDAVVRICEAALVGARVEGGGQVSVRGVRSGLRGLRLAAEPAAGGGQEHQDEGHGQER